MWRKASVRYGVCFWAHVTISQLCSGYAEARNDMVSIKRKHTLFWNLCKGSNQCRASFPDRRQECSATRSRCADVSRRPLCRFSHQLTPVLAISTTLTPFSSIRRARRATDAIVNELQWCPFVYLLLLHLDLSKVSQVCLLAQSITWYLLLLYLTLGVVHYAHYF